MEIEVMEIKPDMATKMLEHGIKNNRNISPVLTKKYADDMRRNRWDLNGETIKLVNEREERNPPLFLYTVIDGQHRLTACVKARKSFRTAVAFVESAKSFSTIDCGKVRSAGDICSILGHKNSPALAAALKLQVKVEENKLVDTAVGAGSTSDIRNHEIEKELSTRMGLVDSVAVARTWKGRLKTRPACMAVAHFNICKIDKELGEECLKAFHTGEGLNAGNPILAYRNFLISWMQNENNKLTNHYLLKGLYLMWNGWVTGKSITRCCVKKAGPLPRLRRP